MGDWHRIGRVLLVVGAAGALTAGPTTLSASAYLPPEPNDGNGAVVEVPVPVQVPVDDAAAEALQMGIAALAGAGLVGSATAAHYRRRVPLPPLPAEPLEVELGEW